jgi:hypothetical protein
MGAELWQYDVPGQTDPDAAFEALYARVFDEYTQRYPIDLPEMVRDAAARKRELIASARANGDPFKIVDSCQESLAEVELLSSQPVPADKPGQAKLFRKVWDAMMLNEPIGNLLDTVGITRDPQNNPFYCRVLSDEEIRQHCGSDKPTLPQSRKAFHTVYEFLDRAESVCWPYYGEAANVIGYYFVGMSFD